MDARGQRSGAGRACLASCFAVTAPAVWAWAARGAWVAPAAWAVVALAAFVAVAAAASPAVRSADSPGEIGRLHAWGLAVDADGFVYAADGRVEPGCVWRLAPEVFAPDEGDGGEGRRPGEADSGAEDALDETFGAENAVEGTVVAAAAVDGAAVLVEVPGIRDLQLAADGTLFVSAYRVVRTESAPGDSVSRPEHAILRVDRKDVEEFVPWTPVDSLYSGPCFRVDERGGVYFPWAGRLRYRHPDGEVTTFLGSAFQGERDGGVGFARFNDVRAMSWAQGGELLLVDVAKVRRVSIAERSVETFASALIERRVAREEVGEEGDPRYDNRIYGIAPDADGDRIWVAYHGGRKLLSTRRSGRSGTYYAPRDSGWGPVGVVWTEGAVYVLEVHGTVSRDLRVTRIAPSGETRVVLPRRLVR